MLKKEREDPNYKGPLSPTAKKPQHPTIPSKDKKKYKDERGRSSVRTAGKATITSLKRRQ